MSRFYRNFIRVFVKFVFIIFIILRSLSQSNVSPIYACTPTPEGKPPPTVADRVRSADVVLIGTVTTVTETGEPSATVQVEQYFKGADTGIEQVEILGFGGSWVCRRYVEVGDRFIFYALQYGDGTLHAHWLTAGDAVASPTNALIAEITTALSRPPDMDIAHPSPALVTHTPLPPTASITSSTPIITDTPLPETVATVPPATAVELMPLPVTPPIETSSSPILAGIGILLVLILVTAVLWYRHNQTR